jgi:hypothetical protein
MKGDRLLDSPAKKKSVGNFCGEFGGGGAAAVERIGHRGGCDCGSSLDL